MTGQQLRNSILQEAIQGRLVKQDPEDESVSSLFESIQQAKNRWIKEGRIKKDKVSSFIPEEDIPFAIPDSWKWVRVQDLFNVRSALRIHQTDWQSEGIPFFRGRELVQLANTGHTNPEIFISRELYERNKAKGGVPQKNDLLVSAVGTIGKVYIVQGTKEFYYKDAYILCFENFANIYVDYIKYALESPYLQEEIHRDSMATTVAQLTIIKAKSLLIPLPPVSEQKRIVEKLESLFPLVEEYDKASGELKTLNEILPNKLRKAVLQEAIRGNLVPNNIPNDEKYGKELLKEIKHKIDLVYKEGLERKSTKIAKKESLTDFIFEIPENWIWCRLGDLCHIAGRIGFRGYTKADIVPSGGAISLSPSNIIDGIISFSHYTMISMEKYDESPEIKVRDGEIVFTKTASVGKCAYIETVPMPTTINPQMVVMKHICCDAKYLTFVLQSPYAVQNYNAFVIGTSIPTFSQAVLESLLIPLPPLSIQHRIVEKIEEVFSAINTL